MHVRMVWYGQIRKLTRCVQVCPGVSRCVQGLTKIAVAPWPLRPPSCPRAEKFKVQRHSPDPGWWLAIATNRPPPLSTSWDSPTLEAANGGYTVSPELWIALASSHDRRHKNPDEPASPTARASKAARVQVQGPFSKIELDRGPFTEYI